MCEKKMNKKTIVILVTITIVSVIGLLIYRTLAYTPELAIHQMRGEVTNVVYISPDGHDEAVYDKNGNLVINLYNKGSYNYCHPVKEPICHFSKDIIPWLKWGNDREDPTNFSERLSAYSIDLKYGFLKSIGYY